MQMRNLRGHFHLFNISFLMPYADECRLMPLILFALKTGKTLTKKNHVMRFICVAKCMRIILKSLGPERE